MTNYEKIKQMSVEEMAECLGTKTACDFCVTLDEDDCVNNKCIDNIKDWLESEVEEC